VEHPLTLRQHQVVIGLAAGNSVDDVADHLGLSPKTIRRHLEKAYRRLGVSSHGQAVYRLARAGCLGAPRPKAIPQPESSLTDFQRAYLAAFDDYLKDGNPQARLRMKAALVGASVDAGVMNRPARPEPADPLDRLLRRILSEW
jgi:DNA-binding CsgD family transcriptional regulator